MMQYFLYIYKYIYMSRAIWEFAQSADCSAQSRDPWIARQSGNFQIAQVWSHLVTWAIWELFSCTICKSLKRNLQIAQLSNLLITQLSNLQIAQLSNLQIAQRQSADRSGAICRSLRHNLQIAQGQSAYWSVEQFEDQWMLIYVLYISNSKPPASSLLCKFSDIILYSIFFVKL